jgi:lysophospholipase L1-like esterase
MKGKLGKKQIVIIVVCIFAALAIAAASSVTAYKFGAISGYNKLVSAADSQIKVACVGDSITYGYGVQGWPENSYPKVLNKLLGDGYVVNNYGYSGRCAMKSGDYPYTEEKIYKQGLEFLPDIVVIMLGTNDTKKRNWKGKAAFVNDYSSIIDNYIALESAPAVYIIAPPPVFSKAVDINQKLVDTDVYDAAKEIAQSKSLGFIDMKEVFKGRGELFIDGLHPTAKGAEIFARTVYSAIVTV